MKHINHRVSALALATALAATLALGACANGPAVITDGSVERQRAADDAQRQADVLRSAGGSAAAKDAQRRADAAEREAKRKPSSFLEWIVDVLFDSALASATPPVMRK